MKSSPEGLSDAELIAAVVEGWGIEVVGARYFPEGGGSYHWILDAAAGTRYFITVDDLDHKAFLGAAPDTAFDGLRRALDTATRLQNAGGLQFVLAPLQTGVGECVRRLSAHHAVAVYPFVAGTSGPFGEQRTPDEREELIRMLARLHAATGLVAATARTAAVELPNRQMLAVCLDSIDRTWSGGPLSEPARELLTGHAGQVRLDLATFDGLATSVLRRAAVDPVITHGEMHAGNLIRSEAGLMLIDWDTSGMAVAERDLWMLEPTPGDLDLYTELSGRSVDLAAIEVYRSRWRLDDIATFADELRGPHHDTADTRHALQSLASYFEA